MATLVCFIKRAFSLLLNGERFREFILIAQAQETFVVVYCSCFILFLFVSCILGE